MKYHYLTMVAYENSCKCFNQTRAGHFNHPPSPAKKKKKKQEWKIGQIKFYVWKYNNSIEIQNYDIFGYSYKIRLKIL